MALPAAQLEGRSAELESLVQEVLRRLAAIASAPSEAGATAALPAADTALPAANTARLAIRERVVTMAALRDRLSGVQQVVVHPRAIVTPLVRDELKQRRIELLRCDATTDAAGQQVSVVLGICAPPAVDLERMLRDRGVRIERTWQADEPAVCRSLATALVAGSVRGIVVSRQPAAAACLANRSPVLRAIAGTDPQLVREAVASWAPNVLVLPPGVAQLAEIVESFLQAGEQPCPPPWKLWFEATAR